MANLLQQLENNEAILLMYLADELPADDRREVEQLLEQDAGLRAALDRISSAQSAVMAGLGELDASEPLRISETVVVRQMSRIVKQWQVDQLAIEPEVVEPNRLRFAWWIYPAVSAASILLAVIIWWGMNSDYSRLGKVTDEQQIAEARQVASPVMASYRDADEANGSIPEAEQQALALASHTGDAAVVFPIEDDHQ